MASINVSEADFRAAAAGAWACKAAGDEESAAALDKIARKINAVLTNGTVSRASPLKMTDQPKWEDMPSVFDIG